MAAQMIIWNLFIFRYATEVDVDFVRKSVRAIGRCAIKVEVGFFLSLETLLFLSWKVFLPFFSFLLFAPLVRVRDTSSWNSQDSQCR